MDLLSQSWRQLAMPEGYKFFQSNYCTNGLLSASYYLCYYTIKGARYLLIIHEVLVAMDFFPAGVQDEALEEESQRLAS